jgi:hypothetical protein
LAEQWEYGPERDNALYLMSPCPESEKENDRCTATETLKAILKLDYKVSSEDIIPASSAAERRSHREETSQSYKTNSAKKIWKDSSSYFAQRIDHSPDEIPS